MAHIQATKLQCATMHIMVILFGVGAWVAINGVWVELPVLVTNPSKSLPEGWNLPSYLVALSQVANIGPLIVTLMQKFAPDYYRQNLLIYAILAMGTISCFLLCFLWDVTAYFGGKEHSITFFVLFFILAFVDCTSSVSFLPFMSRFQKVFLTTYFIGEGLSGFLPSIVALIQGASESQCVNTSYVNTTTNETQYHIVAENTEPRFSVDWFFAFLFCMMASSTTCFILLNHTDIARIFTNKQNTETSPLDSNDPCASTSTELSTFSSEAGHETASYSKGKLTHKEETDHQKLYQRQDPTSTLNFLTSKQYIFLYVVISWISCLSNGILPSVISYTSLPYGQLPYHFAATLGAMANPVACLIALFLPVKSQLIVALLTLIATGVGAFLMLLAVQSPCPILVGTGAGSAIMICSQVIFNGAAAYTKVSVAQIIRERGSMKSLVWYGAFTQLGSMVGALTMFPLVNVYYLFVAGDSCSTIC